MKLPAFPTQDLLLIDFSILTTETQEHLGGVTAAATQSLGIMNPSVRDYYQLAKISSLGE